MPNKMLPVSGGLVTSRDASLLKFDDGELAVASDAHYKPGDPALYKNNGRTAFDSAVEGATAIKGLAYCQFDGATDLLIKMQGTTYYTATAGATGTWSRK